MTLRKMACRLALTTALLTTTAPVALAQTAPPPERREVGTLVFDGIPAIPPGLRPQIQRYRNARSASFQDWLADGSMLITTRFGETAQVHRVAAPGADRRQLTFFGEPIAQAVAVPGAADRYAYARDTGGAEYFQIYIAGLDGSETPLTEPGTRNEDVIFSGDGRTAFWAQVRPGEPDYDIIAADLTSGARRVIYEGSGAWSPVDASRDGSRILIGKYNSIQDSQLWLLDTATGQASRIRPGSTPVSYGQAMLTPDGRSVIATSDEGSDAQRLVEISLADGELTPLTGEARWDVEGFDLSPDGRVLAWATNEDGFSRVHLRDLRTRRALPQPNLPVGIVGALKFSPDGQSLAINMSTPASSGDVWAWNVDGGGLTRWTSSEVGPVNALTFVTPELVRFESFDGLSIPAFVYRPTGGEGRRPVIIDIHGGPEGQSRPGFNPTYQQWIADLGAAVIVPNVRGSTGYGKAYVALDNGPLRQNSVQDIGALLDWIATQPDLDPERVVVHGGSYGGFMVLASLAAYSDRLAGAVDIVGISNFVSFLENTEGYRRDLRRAEYGDERDPAMRAVFEQISPLNLTDRMTRPLLVIQGANDPRVPRSEAEQIVRAVREDGRPVWYLLAMDEGHGFRKKSNADAQAEVTNLFLRDVFGLGVAP
ncbi:MAG: prolyl oligopeptidase family serine peptidase [Brevundimonas sp.]|nr:prolyl oligopeptidase family serine peptidase [Brevundimonas sp.]